jgi:hypothetical protein
MFARGKAALPPRIGSSPSPATIKETSFVYHGKRRSFCVFSNKMAKIRQNIAK